MKHANLLDNLDGISGVGSHYLVDNMNTTIQDIILVMFNTKQISLVNIQMLRYSTNVDNAASIPIRICEFINVLMNNCRHT